ncbi:MAG: DMT family transporter [Pseudomonadota bacterium]
MLMLLFCLFAPMGDSVAKLLGPSVPLLQLLAVRFVLQALLLLPIVMVTNRTLTMGSREMRLTLVRTVLHILGVGAMFLSLRFLPLADAVAIAFVMPFIMLLLGHFVLGEVVGWRRIAACAVGFMGTLLVIQPSFAAVGAPALLPLAVALIFAGFMLVTRQMAKQVDAIAMQCVSGFMALPILALFFALAAPLGWPEARFVWPAQTEIALLFLLGVLGTTGHLFMTWSLRFAPSATLAPMQYLEIPIATALGYLIFADLPNGLAALGIIITIVAGLTIIALEHRVAKEATTPPM